MDMTADTKRKQQLEEEQAFNEAFDEVFKDDKQSPPAPAPKDDTKEGAAPQPDVPAKAEPPTDTNKDQDVPPAQEGKPGEKKEPKEPPATTPDATAAVDVPDDGGDADWKAKYEAELHRNQSWHGRIKAANKRAEEAAARLKELEEEVAKLRAQLGDKQKGSPDPVDDEPDQVSPPSPDLDGDQDVVQFKEDFPDIAPPVEKLIQAKVREATAKLKQLEAEQKAQAERQALEQLRREHFAKIRKAHPDLDELTQGTHVIDWIESQPQYLQPGLQAVLDHGTADQVIELLSAFKRDAGILPPEGSNPGGGDKPPAKTPEADLQKMVGVNPSQTAPKTTTPKNKDDFDSAWEEAPEKEFSFT